MKKENWIFLTTLLLLSFVANAQHHAVQEEEWTLEQDSFILKGTLSTPGTSNKTAVLFISGSGPTDRDGNNPFMKNNSLKGLSDSLVTKGFTTLRFDKRGIGESSSQALDESTLTFETYVSDVSHWLSKLKDSFPDYDLALIGHSEGSLIGILAAQQNEINGFVSLAGSGRPFEVIVQEQLNKQMPALVSESDSILQRIKSGETVEEMNPILLNLYRPSVQPYLRSYMKYDPAIEIAKLKIPILIVQGQNDLQITEQDAMALHKAYPKATLELIPHMNHVLKEIKGDAMENQMSYGNPNLPVSRELLDVVVNFFKKL